MATDVWTNKTVTVDHVEEKPFGNGIDVCPVCGKPSTIGKPQTNADRIRSMSDEELAEWFVTIQDDISDYYDKGHSVAPELPTFATDWLEWLKTEVKDDRN